MLTSNMSGGSCAATRLTSRLASPGARATTRTLRPRPPMLLASMSPRPRRPLCCAWTKSLRSSAGLSEVAQWPRLDRPEPRLQAAWHDNTVCGARSLHRKDYRDAFKTPSPRRVSRLHEQCCAAFPNRKLHVILDNLNTHKKNEDWLKAQPLAFLAAQPH